jgi:hypothetical protein
MFENKAEIEVQERKQGQLNGHIRTGPTKGNET